MNLLDLLICAEDRSKYKVSLWTVSRGDNPREIRRGPDLDWRSFSQTLESTRAMSQSTLGAIDACISRGESVRTPLSHSDVIKDYLFEAIRGVPKVKNFVQVS